MCAICASAGLGQELAGWPVAVVLYTIGRRSMCVSVRASDPGEGRWPRPHEVGQGRRGQGRALSLLVKQGVLSQGPPDAFRRSSK